MSPVTLITGSLTALMDALSAAQLEVADSPIIADLEPLTCYRWRDSAPDAPALWNWWASPETSSQRDTARRLDSFFIETRIAVNPYDDDERLADLEKYVDAYRAVMDPIFRREVAGSSALLLGGAARWAERVSLAPFGENEGGTVLAGVAFVQRFDVDRIVLPGAP